MKKLIITADDFGMSRSVNDAIIECIESGVVCSTNVMINMPFYEEAKMLKEKYANVSVGIHYTFTVGKPVLPCEEVKTLVDNNGFFHSYKTFRKMYHKGLINDNEIKKEIKAQYDKYIKTIGEPDYWNTHENVHVALKLYKVFRDTSLSLGIKKMRSHQRIYLPSSSKKDMPLKWYILNPIKTFIINRWQKGSKKLGVSSPEGLIVRLNEKDKFDFLYMCKNIRWKSNTIGELTIHPATKNDCEYFGDITEKRISEYKFFSDKSILEIAKSNNIKICSFGEI